MRTLKIMLPALALAGFVSLSVVAQQPAPSPSPSTPQSTPAQPDAGSQQTAPSAQPQNDSKAASAAPSTASAPEVSNEQLRPVTGELEKKIDSKNAKLGDQVIVKTTEQATTASGTVIPKGSRIVGHVTEVQAHSKTNPNSRLTIQFDQAEIKGGQTLLIRTVLESVAPPPMTVHPSDTMSSPGMASAPTGSPSMAGNTGAMSGIPGGAAPGGSPATTAASSGAPTMSQGTEQQAANANPKTGAVVARQGNVAFTTTAVPGVLLATNASGQPFSNASGALLGAKQDVHLDGGTEIVLAVMDTPLRPGTR